MREAMRESRLSRLCNKKEEGSAEGRQADEYWDRIQRLLTAAAADTAD